jgi:hypothetical protein
MSRGIRSCRKQNFDDAFADDVGFVDRELSRWQTSTPACAWCWRFGPFFSANPTSFCTRGFQEAIKETGQAEATRFARRSPVLEPDGGALANSRRLAQALRSFKLCWPKLENIDGMRSQPRTFCLHARERSRRDAAELVVAIIAQVALRRSAAGAIGLNFNFEANLHDLIGRHSEIRRWQVCVEVHGCE